MNSVNKKFQDFLKEKNFHMKKIEKDDSWVYQGKIAFNDVHILTFSILLSKNELDNVGQIVYQNIAYIRENDSYEEWYRLINYLNLKYGVYYYFCIDDNNRVFARYICDISEGFEGFYNILIKGPSILSEVIPIIENKFGQFVVLN